MKRPVIIGLLIVALALVCVGIGTVAFFTFNSTFTANNPFDRRNISSQVEENKTLKVDATKPVTLKVEDAAGGVTVTGADVANVQVKAVKTAYDSTQARADAELKTIKYTIEQTGNVITLKYELPKSMNFNNKVDTVDFIVTVPTETSVDINSSTGNVDVSGLQGQVAIENRFGDITVGKVDGALQAKTNSGSVDVTSVAAGTGNINLNSGFGTIAMVQASGADVQVESSSGALHLKNVRASGDMGLSSDFGTVKFDSGSAASLTASTKSGAVELTSVNISGTLAVRDDFGEINLEQVHAQSYDLQTNSGSITVDGAQGTVKADTGFGNITIQNAENTTLTLNTKSGAIHFTGSLGEGPHTFHSDFGEVTLTIPADSALNVDFQTDFGKVRSDLPVTMTLTGDIDQAHQTGTINGGGSQLSASTKSGDITVKASGS
ncbi:MAG: DUF4097 family beta strand repeat-containing protein [Bacteroidota bacterium]